MKLACSLLLLLALVGSSICETTLQTAFSAAFNRRMADGTWSTVFGNVGGLSNADFCYGSSVDYWQFPIALPATDLYEVLISGKFVCGIPANTVLYADDGTLLLSAGETGATGLIPNFFSTLASTLSAHYGYRIDVTWQTKYTDDDSTLVAVMNGEIDAACGAFAPGATVTVDSSTVPRVQVMNLLSCYTFLQTVPIYTSIGSEVTTWQELITAILNDPTFVVCTNDGPNDGTTQSCTATLGMYLPGTPFSCTGQKNNTFAALNLGTCNAVWGGYPTMLTEEDYNVFYAPGTAADGTFFRVEDGVYFSSASSMGVSALLVAVVGMFAVLMM